MTKVPSLEEVEAMDDEQSLKVEAGLIEESNNQVRPEDGPQPASDESPGLEEVDD
jgi:hypothetical protein